MRWTLVILFLVAGLGAFVIQRNPRWVKVENFVIELAEDSQEEVLFQRISTSLRAQLAAYQGEYFWDLPLKKLHELVSRDKRVKSVEIFREFPSQVRIKIEPHTPVLAYLARDGRIYPVATDGALLPAVAVADAPDLPVLRGDAFKDELGLRELAIELLSLVPTEGSFTKKDVSEIVYSPKEGFKVFISGARSELKFGDSDFGPKISRVQKVLSYLESQSIKGRVIDARFSKKVVVRVRNSP